MHQKIRQFMLSLFVIMAACLLVFQITYTETDKFWKNKITDMLFSGKTDVENSLSEVTEIVNDNYVGEKDSEKASENVMNGYMASLDKFSMYMNEEQYNSYLALQNNANNVGIGVNALYDSTLDGIFVVNVHRGSPAELSGMVPGDIITHVDGVSVKQLGYYSSMAKIALGDENEQVHLTIKRNDGSIGQCSVSRKKVEQEKISGEKLGSSIGLINISGFAPGDEEVFKATMEDLIVGGCEKFVIDVRNNSGGNFEAISRILDFLLEEGELFSVTEGSKSNAKNTVLSDTNSVPYPLAVLVNKGTVGGAEIFAAALNESDRVKLFGTNTYGKATTQEIFPLSSGGALCISTKVYTTKDGKSFDSIGVVPDTTVELPIELKMSYTTLTKNQDTPLQEAITYLKSQQALSKG
ncbi:MAG: PDZ domain-containing protein [Ruminococcaceae bacterium]|nr:PDZ domain-containing protein [Oscillospiraceae bacterium]